MGESSSLQYDSWRWLRFISRPAWQGVPLPIFYAESGAAIMTAETIEHVSSTLWGTRFLSYNWERDAKDTLPEGFTHQVHQMASSKKRNRYHGRMVWLRFIMEWVVVNRRTQDTQQIFTLKVLTNITVVGSTHHLSHLLLTMALLTYKQICHRICPWW